MKNLCIRALDPADLSSADPTILPPCHPSASQQSHGPLSCTDLVLTWPYYSARHHWTSASASPALGPTSMSYGTFVTLDHPEYQE